jgi:hypothetical protein
VSSLVSSLPLLLDACPAVVLEPSLVVGAVLSLEPAVPGWFVHWPESPAARSP